MVQRERLCAQQFPDGFRQVAHKGCNEWLTVQGLDALFDRLCRDALFDAHRRVREVVNQGDEIIECRPGCIVICLGQTQHHINSRLRQDPLEHLFPVQN